MIVGIREQNRFKYATFVLRQIFTVVLLNFTVVKNSAFSHLLSHSFTYSLTYSLTNSTSPAFFLSFFVVIFLYDCIVNDICQLVRMTMCGHLPVVMAVQIPHQHSSKWQLWLKSITWLDHQSPFRFISSFRSKNDPPKGHLSFIQNPHSNRLPQLSH